MLCAAEKILIRLTLIAGCLAASSAFALTLPMPQAGNDIIGAESRTKVLSGENLADVSRRVKMGAKEIMDANPRVKPWTPRAGANILVPSRFILPSGERKGIVINLPELRLYYYHPDGKHVTTYPIGIGKQGWATPIARTKIIGKKKNPSWRVPKSILAEKEAKGIIHPKVVPPGPDNPLGKHAIRLGLPGYLIHGTNRNRGIGLRVSHGCIRLHPNAIADLFNKVSVGTPVRIVHEPYKFGQHNGKLYFEAHQALNEREFAAHRGGNALRKAVNKNKSKLNSRQMKKVQGIAVRHYGVPVKLY